MAGTSAPIAVILHCYYPDQLELIGFYLARLPSFTLYISIVDERFFKEVALWCDKLAAKLPALINFNIHVFPNDGRDIVPFAKTLNLLIGDHRVFLKLHTKLSPHLQVENMANIRAGSDSWIDHLLSSLVPAEMNCIDFICDSLGLGNKVAGVFPFPWPRVQHVGWNSYANYLHATVILERLSVPLEILGRPLVYPAGTMFWGSVEVYAEWFNRVINILKIPQEPISPDGTALHAIERLIGYFAGLSNKSILLSNFSRNDNSLYDLTAYRVNECSVQILQGKLINNEDVCRSQYSGNSYVSCPPSGLLNYMIQNYHDKSPLRLIAENLRPACKQIFGKFKTKF